MSRRIRKHLKTIELLLMFIFSDLEYLALFPSLLPFVLDRLKISHYIRNMSVLFKDYYDGEFSIFIWILYYSHVIPM